MAAPIPGESLLLGCAPCTERMGVPHVWWWCETLLSSSFPKLLEERQPFHTGRQRAGASEVSVLRLWRGTLRAVRSSLKLMPPLLVS